MRIGVFMALFQNLPFEQALDKAIAAGVSAVEIGAGGYASTPHCPVDDLLESESGREAYIQAITSRGLILSALSCHGNPIGPDKEFARQCDSNFRKLVRLAQLLEVPVVNAFSGAST